MGSCLFGTLAAIQARLASEPIYSVTVLEIGPGALHRGPIGAIIGASLSRDNREAISNFQIFSGIFPKTSKNKRIMKNSIKNWYVWVKTNIFALIRLKLNDINK